MTDVSSLAGFSAEVINSAPTGTEYGLVVRPVGGGSGGSTVVEGQGTPGTPVGGVLTVQGDPAAAPVPVAVATSSTGVGASVAASATVVTLLAANASRKGATIYNDSATEVLSVFLGAGASATQFTVKLAAGASIGGYYEVPYGYTGVITGIWTAAVGNARVTELT